ncbi:phage portal protein [Lacticaseibacillus pabuli]|uniref:Phage portal protein n=1 Tax=Lacticaseibacillus pabuli TaxID=3025672 RepID=A0ABY7WV81_9LACO|nr:phage portal protein [Lacticaseibacillus sp. KACC 23028]WDF81820.1 phage portal protein [Lacticaseibacillus sp. KACC 23028]
MSVFSSLWDIVTRRKDTSFVFDSDMFEMNAQHIYLKRLAIDTNLNFIARAFSQNEFRVLDDKSKSDKKSTLYYKLNVRPNPNQSAGQFWNELIYHLFYNGEALVIQSDEDDLFVADNFMADDTALNAKTFSGVTVGSYTYNRTFDMDDVLYFKASNYRLEHYIGQLFDDTSKLYDRMYDVAMRDKQVRAVLKVGAMAGVTPVEKQAKLQSWIDNTFKQFNERSIAIIPNTDGLEYEEKNPAQESRGQSPVENLQQLRSGFMDDVALILGIPPVLLHGQQASVDQAQQTFIDYCLTPLNKQIESELNSKFISPMQYRHGKHVSITGLDKINVANLAEPLDKLRAGGFVNGDEGRVMLGMDPTGKSEMQEYYVTKNYGSAGGDAGDSGTGSTDTGADDSTKGGVNNDEDSD